MAIHKLGTGNTTSQSKSTDKQEMSSGGSCSEVDHREAAK